MAYFYSTHNFGTGEHFGFDVISLKVSQTELQISRKSDTVLTQYADQLHNKSVKKNDFWEQLLRSVTLVSSQFFFTFYFPVSIPQTSQWT